MSVAKIFDILGRSLEYHRSEVENIEDKNSYEYRGKSIQLSNFEENLNPDILKWVPTHVRDLALRESFRDGAIATVTRGMGPLLDFEIKNKEHHVHILNNPDLSSPFGRAEFRFVVGDHLNFIYDELCNSRDRLEHALGEDEYWNNLNDSDSSNSQLSHTSSASDDSDYDIFSEGLTLVSALIQDNINLPEIAEYLLWLARLMVQEELDDRFRSMFLKHSASILVDLDGIHPSKLCI
ncbi:hypothetical protein HDV00_010987 [Rhizophlyctis rosea]|nr:hypothetical protein HDV00_010987 [Rhizophlyctis rosea]